MLAAWAGFGGGPARAQDLGPVLGPLAPNVSLGTSGAWSVLTEGGRLVLSDTDDPGAIRFYSTAWQGDRAAGRSAGARVQATGMGSAAAGLVYNVRDEYPRWAALVVTADKSVVVYARQASGLIEVKRAPIPGGPHPDGELLQISERGGTTTLFANGVEIAQLNMAGNGQAPSDRPVGILAVGPGRFTFRDFAFGQAVVPQAGGDDRVPGREPPVTGNDDRVPTPGPGGSTPPVADTRRWPVPQLDPLAANVLGATMGILAHEFGHFVIGELKIPATGPEEDVADEFAAMVFVDNMQDMPEAAAGMALAMAKFWWYAAEDRGDRNQPPWFDEHAPDRARFARIMCMLYGASPKLFEPVMQQTGIPERTRARCIDDERKRHAAWDNLLRKHRRRGVDPVMPGDLDPATPGKRVTVEFRPPSNPRYQPLASFLQQSRMLDTAADLLSKLYVLPRDTKIIVAECGTVNCFYKPSDGSVTMCYEMMAFVLDVFARHEGSNGPVGGEPGGTAPRTPVSVPGGTSPNTTPGTAPTPDRTSPGGKPPPLPSAENDPPPAPPQTRQPGSSMNLAQFLTGTWRLQIKSPNGVVDDVQVEAMADGSYRARHNAGLPNSPNRLVVAVLGRWSAEPAEGERQFRLTLTPVQWSPQQVCGNNGCQPLNLGPTRTTVQIIDNNTLVSAEGRATRVQ